MLLLVDRQAEWNQELANVCLVACEISDDDCGRRHQHFAFELTTAPDFSTGPNLR